jgi:hypothetical protein
MNNTDSILHILFQICIKAAWAPPAVFFLHSLAAQQWGHEPYVDPIMHFSGGMAMAFFFWQSAKYCQRYLGNPSVMVLACIAFGMAAFTAIAWEIMEYGLALQDNNPMWLGQNLLNSLRDIALGMSGALLLVGLSVRNRLLRQRQ